MSSAFTNQNRKEIALSGSDWSPHQMRNSDYDNDTVSRPTSGYDSDMWTYGKIFFWLNRRIISNIMEISLKCKNFWIYKVGCVFPMVIVSVLHHAESDQMTRKTHHTLFGCWNYKRVGSKIDSFEPNWMFIWIKWTVIWLKAVSFNNEKWNFYHRLSTFWPFCLDLIYRPICPRTIQFRLDPESNYRTQPLKTCEIFVLWIVNAWFD